MAPRKRYDLDVFDEDLGEVIEDTDGRKGITKTIRRVLNHRKLAVILLVGVVFVILLLVLWFSNNSQKELQEQLEQQEVQLERQNQLIEALKDRAPEADSHSTIPIITRETVVEQLGSIRELVTQEYIYTNADKRESSATWLWGIERPFSGNSILVTYDGTIKAGVDLSQADIVIDDENQTITVTLPPSQITDNNIPQESITVVEVKNGLFNEVTFDNYNEFIAEQKLIMEQRAIGQGLLTKADEEAAALVKSILSVLPGMDAYTLTIEQVE